MGRPTKPPVEGERVSLGLRVTADIKRRLEAAAIKKGRSISQEAELRIEQSLRADNHLTLSKGAYWSPILFAGGQLLIYVDEEEVITLDISPQDKRKLLYAIDEYWPEDEEPLTFGDDQLNAELNKGGR
jgi:hypothetical protein